MSNEHVDNSRAQLQEGSVALLEGEVHAVFSSSQDTGGRVDVLDPWSQGTHVFGHRSECTGLDPM